ncbi:MAG: hypothetical protein A3E37_02380 [Candidatus Andersenbacteria bacterium RIFCSPHIGHO2_12_FULL_46_9]|nr:MAG: Peptidyl-tRNA hydrolase [Parcubacteria group bacterium GW2011_GWA2_45_14]OGY34594.1 MAG: hypothetical protein A3B76_06415 [Candidatus Andersenbacteria bacterium RIFCSPHIGHO2_02_FULL_46_16]OGY36385.1 MAG: hypothetical protein A3E37_02380 [Candidatus Andersenbacteria bacterium RIFCSPHIGHO2_12_FULL_46_9]OGY37879.1 MAG: hypothetical protein A3I08_01670 [Candidatus Andersenbacteria bacterium RIFCSPLOWO2_02_FULL_46_11]OGY42677.1 MAG: hypothetical protein A3G57_03520 [Candidatus Andersenbacter
MKILFGLGNIGKEFKGTRHNLGEAMLRAWEEQATTDGLDGVRLIHPLGLMNNSGDDLVREVGRPLSEVDDLVLIHDDMELPLGECKTTVGGSAKGHNGVRSVLQALGDREITRLRLGIGRPTSGMTARDFVLARFRPEEKALLGVMSERAILLIDQFLFGVETKNN